MDRCFEEPYEFLNLPPNNLKLSSDSKIVTYSRQTYFHQSPFLLQFVERDLINLNLSAVKIIPNEICFQNQMKNETNENQFCLDGGKEFGSCEKDSGNALIYVDPNGNKFIAGILTQCKRGFPIVFTNVSEHVCWIQKTVGSPLNENCILPEKQTIHRSFNDGNPRIGSYRPHFCFERSGKLFHSNKKIQAASGSFFVLVVSIIFFVFLIVVVILKVV